MTTLENAVVLVTGANGGLGNEFVKQALELGASRVYATARTPRTWDDDRIVPLTLDTTDEASVAAAAAAAADTTILINNAGIAVASGIIASPLAEIRQVFETNVFGAISVAQAFAPILKANGGGALVDVHSALSWLGVAGGYSASKAALWSATNTIRLELAPNGTQVLGLHLGYADTPMTAEYDVEKADPADVVRSTYEGVIAGAHEVLTDDFSRDVKSKLSSSIEDMYPQLTPSALV